MPPFGEPRAWAGSEAPSACEVAGQAAGERGGDQEPAVGRRAPYFRRTPHPVIVVSLRDLEPQ